MTHLELPDLRSFRFFHLSPVHILSLTPLRWSLLGEIGIAPFLLFLPKFAFADRSSLRSFFRIVA